MPKNKAPRKKKHIPRVLKNPNKLLNRLPVPDERIGNLKQRAETELLRLYMRTGSIKDVRSLYTTLQLGKVMLKYIDNPADFRPLFEKAEESLGNYSAQSEIIDLDAVRDALDFCYVLWQKVSVNEFVEAAKALRNRNDNSNGQTQEATDG